MWVTGVEKVFQVVTGRGRKKGGGPEASRGCRLISRRAAWRASQRESPSQGVCQWGLAVGEEG